MPEQPKPRHEARPSPEDEDAGRKRLASTLRHGSRAQVVVAVLLAVRGGTVDMASDIGSTLSSADVPDITFE